LKASSEIIENQIEHHRSISIIIPALNEAATFRFFVESLRKRIEPLNIEEIIVVDGGSSDQTLEIAREQQDIKAISSETGRAKQMNAGAAVASGEILYFLHADTLPPPNFINQIYRSNARAGCFRLKFCDTNSLTLKLAGYFTQFQGRIFRGGDQSLFVEKELFEKVGGFDERYDIYEDIELILRLRKLTRFHILQDHVETSARRFHENGIVRLYYHFAVIHAMAILKYPPSKLSGYYKKYVR
jgi:rSAM/selenodomain-associated transferase 2